MELLVWGEKVIGSNPMVLTNFKEVNISWTDKRLLNDLIASGGSGSIPVASSNFYSPVAQR